MCTCGNISKNGEHGTLLKTQYNLDLKFLFSILYPYVVTHVRSHHILSVSRPHRTHSLWQCRSCLERWCTSHRRVHLFCAVSRRSYTGCCFLSCWPLRMWAPSTAAPHPANYLRGPPASDLVRLCVVYPLFAKQIFPRPQSLLFIFNAYALASRYFIQTDLQLCIY